MAFLNDPYDYISSEVTNITQWVNHMLLQNSGIYIFFSCFSVSEIWKDSYAQSDINAVCQSYSPSGQG